MGALAYVVSIDPGLIPDTKARMIQDIEMWSLIFPEHQGEKNNRGREP